MTALRRRAARRRASTSPRARRPPRKARPSNAFGRLFGASPLALVLSGFQDGRLFEVNDGFLEIVGRPRADVIGRTAAELGIASPEVSADVRARLARGERVTAMPHEFRTPAGELREVLVSAVRVRVAAKDALLLFVLDTTERRRIAGNLVASEQRYWMLVERNPLPMWVYDLETLRILGANEAAVRHLGYGREELRRMTILDFRPPEEHARLTEEVKDIAGYRFSGLWKIRRADGVIRHIDVLSHDMPFADRPARVVLANDVTERLAAEESLRRSYEELRALAARLESVREEESTRIARAVHDEVGQALTAIKIDLVDIERTLVLAGSAPEPLLRRLEGVARLLDGTLDAVHRISTELRPGVLDELGLEAAIEWQLEEFRQRTGVHCRFDAELGDTPVDAARSTAVFRVLQELLTNVARHAEARHVTARLAAKGRTLVFTLADDGRGISAGAATAPRALGLAGVRERVGNVGGTVDIHGEAGRGTRVTVEIPL